MDDLTDFLLNRQAMLAALVAISIFATILTFAMPLLQTDRLGRRMKIVASERERIRARERERLADRRSPCASSQKPI